MELANNGFNLGEGGGGEQNSSTKNMSHPCTFRYNSVFCGEGRQIRPAELGKQPEFWSSVWMNYQASNPESLSETPERLSETKTRSGSPAAAAAKTGSRSANFLHKLEQLDCMTVAKLFNLHGHLQEVT